MLTIFNVNPISSIISQEIIDKGQWIKNEYNIHNLDIESFIHYSFKRYLKTIYGFKFVDYVEILQYDLLYDSLFLDKGTNITHIISTYLNLKDILFTHLNYTWSIMIIDGNLILGYSNTNWRST